MENTPSYISAVAYSCVGAAAVAVLHGCNTTIACDKTSVWQRGL